MTAAFRAVGLGWQPAERLPSHTAAEADDCELAHGACLSAYGEARAGGGEGTLGVVESKHVFAPRDRWNQPNRRPGIGSSLDGNGLPCPG